MCACHWHVIKRDATLDMGNCQRRSTLQNGSKITVHNVCSRAAINPAWDYVLVNLIHHMRMQTQLMMVPCTPMNVTISGYISVGNTMMAYTRSQISHPLIIHWTLTSTANLHTLDDVCIQIPIHTTHWWRCHCTQSSWPMSARSLHNSKQCLVSKFVADTCVLSLWRLHSLRTQGRWPLSARSLQTSKPCMF